jgi:uncharacterized protein YcfL
MLKKTFLAALSLFALSATPSAWADEPVAAQPESAELVAAPMAPAEAVAAPAATTASGTASKPAATTQNKQLNDNHVDYRYCLELKTNREIAECRYKKK